MKRVTIAVLCFALCSAATAQQRLREGILVDVPRNTAYVMAPDHGIAAVELTTGEVRWRTTAAAKPLAILGSRLVAQAETTGAQRNVLQLAVLDVEQRGQPVTRTAATLPANVRVATTETLNGKFSVTASGTLSTATIEWSFVPLPPLRGFVEEEEVRPETARRTSEPIRGAIRLTVSTGAVSTTAAAGTAANANPTWVIRASEIDESPATQYESADGRHILTSQRVADDPEWNKYRWTITNRATGQVLGQFRNHLSFTPFVVVDSTAVYETTPYIVGDDVQPAKLRGIDVRTGQEVWSIEVREVVYRGDTPP